MADVLVPAGELREFIRQVALQAGSDEAGATELAHHLVRANLSGHDSHGVLRMPWYVSQIDQGALQPAAQPEVIREFGATAVFDAGRCFGQYSTIVALEWAIAKAREHGVASVAIRNSMHIGRLGEYPERAAAQGMVCMIAYGSAGPGTGIVVPFGGKERFLGTNPWAFGVPTDGEHPMLFDAATSVIAEGKIRVALSKSAQLPEGCIVDESGLPSTEPNDFYAGGALLPNGGGVSGHKGYSLAMTAALVGGLAMIGEDPRKAWDIGPRLGNAAGGSQATGHITGVLITVIDPAAFGDAEAYGQMTSATLNAVRKTQPAPGVERVLAPGDPEVISREKRNRDGIPLPGPIWGDLAALSERFNIPLPSHKDA